MSNYVLLFLGIVVGAVVGAVLASLLVSRDNQRPLEP